MTIQMLFTALASVIGLVRAEANSIHLIKVEGIINAGTARYIERGIESAEKADSKLLIMNLNTPGGLLNFTRTIVQRMNASKVPVAVFVNPSGASATSAGTIITMAAHHAAMAPGTNIGAAHPVGGQGEDIKGEMAEKAVNDTVAFIRAQAAQHGRNADWAEQAIRKSVSVTSDDAARLKVIDFTASDINDLIFKVDKKSPELKVVGLPITELEMTTAEKFLRFIGDPNVSYLLMALGGLGIYAELSAPGLGLPGILGGISLILAFISFSTLPVNYGAVALLALGLILFVAEIFVTSYGVLTIGGIVSLIVGALLLMDPSTGDLRLSLALVIPTAAAIGLISAFVGVAMIRARKTVYQGLVNFAGYEAVVESTDDSGFGGKCHVRGEIWDFKLIDSSVPAKIADHLEVVDRAGMKLTVRLKKGKL